MSNKVGDKKMFLSIIMNNQKLFLQSSLNEQQLFRQHLDFITHIDRVY